MNKYLGVGSYINKIKEEHKNNGAYVIKYILIIGRLILK